MALEFTRLSNVEKLTEVPETASVLAEVDGDIKRIPGDGLGGGKTEWDAIFTVDDIYNYKTDISLVHLTSGDFNAIKTKLDANDLPRVLVVVYWEYGDSMKSCVEAYVEYNITQNAFNIYFHSNWGENVLFSFGIASDGTISPETY